MTAMDAAPPDPTTRPTGEPPRSSDLVLARLHLRLGALALARAELETMAGRDALDVDGVLDLAEARWRTGDVTGAGEAAELVIEDGRGPLVALVIAAEAAMAMGRPTEARRYAGTAVEQAGGGLDAIFAGMPRAAVWPADPLVPPPEVLAMFDTPGAGATLAAAGATARPAPPAPTPSVAAAGAATIGIWADEPGPSDAAPIADAAGPGDIPATTVPAAEPPGGPVLPAALDVLTAGRGAFIDGDLASAAAQLGLAIRLDPGLAPAVLDVLEADRSPELALVRGDAYRLVGRELDARQAFADAALGHHAGAPATDPAHDDRPPQGDPA